MGAKFAVILPAAGKSSRFAHPHYKKPFAMLAGRAVWMHSAERFLNRDDVVQVILVIAEEDREHFQFKFAANVAVLGIDVVRGGEERVDSVRNALARVKPEADFVCVHDAARPCLADVWIDKVFRQAQKSDAAILAVPVSDTLKRVDQKNRIEQTVPRAHLWLAQTPQVFRRDLLVQAYDQTDVAGVTDDAQLVEALGKPVTVVSGSPMNLKITTQDDLRLAEQVLKALPKPKLQGPAHPFADDDLWR